ncbi:MAG: hypothetical protein LBD58_05600 [Treponema sp.]|jgi:hypothetical protein|nr:hypothetical protein [Treponema sp.]
MRMHRELYGGYAEFEEGYMILEERLKPRWKKYLNEGRKRVLALLKQGWTLEQVKAKLAQEQADG